MTIGLDNEVDYPIRRSEHECSRDGQRPIEPAVGFPPVVQSRLSTERLHTGFRFEPQSAQLGRALGWLGCESSIRGYGEEACFSLIRGQSGGGGRTGAACCCCVPLTWGAGM